MRVHPVLWSNPLAGVTIARHTFSMESGTSWISIPKGDHGTHGWSLVFCFEYPVKRQICVARATFHVFIYFDRSITCSNGSKQGNERLRAYHISCYFVRVCLVVLKGELNVKLQHHKHLRLPSSVSSHVDQSGARTKSFLRPRLLPYDIIQDP